MTKYTILLDNETTGTIDSDTLGGRDICTFIGDQMTAHSYDENGNPIEVTGTLTEILDEYF